MTLQFLHCFTATTQRRNELEVVDDSLHTLHHLRDLEVDEQTQSFVEQLQIREKLSLVHRQNPLDRLYLNDYAVVHEHVEPVSVQLDSVVHNGNQPFRDDFLAVLAQFMGQAGSVDTFEKTWPKS